jgi:hypothetical protein
VDGTYSMAVGSAYELTSVGVTGTAEERKEVGLLQIT